LACTSVERTVDVLQTLVVQRPAHAIDVEAELTIFSRTRDAASFFSRSSPAFTTASASAQGRANAKPKQLDAGDDE
jgi:hypothetical protein